ncbi:hypothetical protein [Zunongwangia sp.]|uniref:hypothetical protein n=1 Tax=Zunongwangia sp. TaxID=1965325 RepID=UPI003AA970E2
MSTDNLDSLCQEYISKALKERVSIQQRIDDKYLEIKNEENFKNILKSEFSEEIDNFKMKYRYNFVGIINPKTNELVGIDAECSDKAEELSVYLENYIDKIID